MRNLIVTAAGEALVARLVVGDAEARFTKLCASSEDYSERGSGAMRALTELEGICQTVSVSGTRRVDPSTVEIYAAMDNKALEAGYYTRTIGLYAEDPDGDEILFAVCVEPESPFYMPPFAGKTVSGVSYKLRVKVSSSEKISVDASADVYATAIQLNEAVEQINERIDGLSFEDEIRRHNESEESHPKILEKLSGFEGRLRLVELAASDEITANPFSVTFGDLEGIRTDGLWNDAEARIEF